MAIFINGTKVAGKSPEDPSVFWIKSATAPSDTSSFWLDDNNRLYYYDNNIQQWEEIVWQNK